MQDVNREDIAWHIINSRAGTVMRFMPDWAEATGVYLKLLATPNDKSQNRPILFTFHGAMSPKKYGFPAFSGANTLNAGDAWIVAVSDPAQRLSQDLNVAFFAGDRNFDTVKALSDLFNSLRNAGFTRIITVGGSAGAHAALSVGTAGAADTVLIQNPILEISRYYPSAVQQLLKTAWEDAASLGDIPVIDSAAAYYAAANQHPAVIVVQNATDNHLHSLILPTLTELSRAGDVLLNIDHFPSHIGHTYPVEEWRIWVRAAIESPELTTASIAQTRSNLSAGRKLQGKTTRNHAYSELPDRAFWKRSVSNRHFYEIKEISRPIQLNLSDRLATAGSCFAQHLGRNLKQWGGAYMDCEPPPPHLTPEQRRLLGYDVYSCRYGNIYTTMQLLQLFEEAFGERQPDLVVWQRNGRFYDGLRQAVDPAGFASIEALLNDRKKHLAAVRSMFETLDVFVFTLGLTEAWIGQDGTVFGSAPGVIADPREGGREISFRNFTYPEVKFALESFRRKLLSINGQARILLTVSPVPLMATASGHHVIAATVYSKSTLRAVAGDMAEEYQDVSYFPSFEIISGHQNRGAFFEPDLRSINASGVAHVMSHLRDAMNAKSAVAEVSFEDVICDEEAICKPLGVNEV